MSNEDASNSKSESGDMLSAEANMFEEFEIMSDDAEYIVIMSCDCVSKIVVIRIVHEDKLSVYLR